MPHPKDLNATTQGVDVWNKWVAKNAGLKPDLTDANLSQRNLAGANFSDVDLMGADLSGADLRGALLVGANLTGANLSGANLSGERLGQMKFKETGEVVQTVVRESKFRRSSDGLPGIPVENMSFPYPAGANLSGAVLRGANLELT